MQVKINDVVAEIPDGLNVVGLLAHEKVKWADMVTVQVNGVILERKDFPATFVRADDSVDFLYFMGGGAR